MTFTGPLAVGSHSISQWICRVNNRFLNFQPNVVSGPAGTEVKGFPGEITIGPNFVRYTAVHPTIRDTFDRPIAAFLNFPVTIV